MAEEKLNYLTVLAVLWVCIAWACPISATDRIRFVYFDQFEPFSWEDDGRMQGVFVDVVDLVFKDLNLEVRHQGFPWRRAQMMVKHGQADAMCTIATAERLTYTLPTAYPVVEMAFRVFTASDHPKRHMLETISTLDDLKGFRLIDILGSGWAESNLKDMDVTFDPAYSTMLKLLSQKHFDAAVRNDFQTLYLISKHGFEGEIVALRPLESEPKVYRILIGRTSSLSGSIEGINAALKRISQNGTLQRVLSRYQ